MKMLTTITMTAALLAPTLALSQAVTDSPELYPGEKALYEAASKEGMVVSFDTGPTWANWAAQFAAFKKRYPAVEMTYNDLGSAATVIALDKARNRPQADTAYYFAASGVDAVAKDVVAPFQPVNFDKIAGCVSPSGRKMVHHPLADHRLHREHQAGQDRPAIMGGPAQARIQERSRLSRSAFHWRRSGADVRGLLRAWRQRRQRAAWPRLSRQAARGGKCAARRRHYALCAVRQRRNSGLDLLRE